MTPTYMISVSFIRAMLGQIERLSCPARHWRRSNPNCCHDTTGRRFNDSHQFNQWNQTKQHPHNCARKTRQTQTLALNESHLFPQTSQKHCTPSKDQKSIISLVKNIYLNRKSHLASGPPPSIANLGTISCLSFSGAFFPSTPHNACRTAERTHLLCVWHWDLFSGVN